VAVKLNTAALEGRLDFQQQEDYLWALWKFCRWDDLPAPKKISAQQLGFTPRSWDEHLYDNKAAQKDIAKMPLAYKSAAGNVLWGTQDELLRHPDRVEDIQFTVILRKNAADDELGFRVQKVAGQQYLLVVSVLPYTGLARQYNLSSPPVKQIKKGDRIIKVNIEKEPDKMIAEMNNGEESMVLNMSVLGQRFIPQARLAVGDVVEALHKDGKWAGAKIKEALSDGTYIVEWNHGDTEDTRKQRHDLFKASVDAQKATVEGESITVAFQPGEVGIYPNKEYDNGLVDAVKEGSQAWKLGVQAGWKIIAVGNAKCTSFYDQPFTDSAHGLAPYQLTFVKPKKADEKPLEKLPATANAGIEYYALPQGKPNPKPLALHVPPSMVAYPLPTYSSLSVMQQLAGTSYKIEPVVNVPNVPIFTQAAPLVPGVQLPVFSNSMLPAPMAPGMQLGQFVYA